MDKIVKEVGLRNNCTFCGVFRRQALDRGAVLMKADKIVTGHNADDIAETVLMNCKQFLHRQQPLLSFPIPSLTFLLRLCVCVVASSAPW